MKCEVHFLFSISSAPCYASPMTYPSDTARRRRSREMLTELAEMSRSLARSLRRRAEAGETPRDAMRLVRVAADLEWEAMLALELEDRLRGEHRQREFGIVSLREARPPTPTRH